MYILFDIGGTKMRLATSTDTQTFTEPQIIDTPATDEDIVSVLKNVAAEPTAIAGGLTRRRTAVADKIKTAFNCPIYLENDTAIVGLGEAAAGAGVGSKILAYITVSTGVGGVRIVDGVVDHGIHGFEPGHQIIDLNEPNKPFEDYVSGTFVEKTTGKKPREITDPTFWTPFAKTMAVGLHNTIMHWSPDTVVLGGSMMKVPGISVDEVRAELSKISHIFPTLPEIKHSILGDIGGLHGALALVRQKTQS